MTQFHDDMDRYYDMDDEYFDDGYTHYFILWCSICDDPIEIFKGESCTNICTKCIKKNREAVASVIKDYKEKYNG